MPLRRDREDAEAQIHDLYRAVRDGEVASRSEAVRVALQQHPTVDRRGGVVKWNLPALTDRDDDAAADPLDALDLQAPRRSSSPGPARSRPAVDRMSPLGTHARLWNLQLGNGLAGAASGALTWSASQMTGILTT